MTNLADVYRMIKEKNEETGNQNAWVDTENNTIWVIGDTNTLIRFQTGEPLKDKTEKEINDLVAFMLSMDEEEF